MRQNACWTGLLLLLVLQVVSYDCFSLTTKTRRVTWWSSREGSDTSCKKNTRVTFHSFPLVIKLSKIRWRSVEEILVVCLPATSADDENECVVDDECCQHKQVAMTNCSKDCLSLSFSLGNEVTTREDSCFSYLITTTTTKKIQVQPTERNGREKKHDAVREQERGRPRENWWE